MITPMSPGLINCLSPTLRFAPAESWISNIPTVKIRIRRLHWQLHDGGIKYSVGAVEGFDDRDPDESGVAEQQHEYSQVLLGFRQLDQLGDREADSEDDRQDQQADHQYVGTVFEDLQTELHLHRIDDQAGPGEIDDDAVDRTVLIFCEEYFFFLKEDSRDDQNKNHDKGTEYWPYNHQCTSSYDVLFRSCSLSNYIIIYVKRKYVLFRKYVFFSSFSELIRAFMQGKNPKKEVLQTQVYDSKAWKFIALAKFIYSCLRQIC